MITIQETFTLPSLGKVYSKEINPNVTLRSMTTADEAIRQSPSVLEYKPMCDLIDSCIVSDHPWSSYDLCLPDYQFLLHKLRIVTYGPEYHLITRCPNCGGLDDQEINLEDLDVFTFNEEFDKRMTITLPKTNKEVKLQLLTPRMLDTIDKKRNDILTKNPLAIDPRLELLIQFSIDTIDGNKYDFVSLEKFVQDLPMMDTNEILNKSDELNSSLGIDVVLGCHCSKCKQNYISTFRQSSEFFRPTRNKGWSTLRTN